MKEILKVIPRNPFEKSYIQGRESCDSKILGRRKRNLEIQLERWIQVVRDGGRQATAGWGLVNKEEKPQRCNSNWIYFPCFPLTVEVAAVPPACVYQKNKVGCGFEASSH